jgi:predicted alpha/beta-fold hydrolase
MIKFINHLSTLLCAINIKEKYDYKKTYFNDICIKYFGDIKTSKHIFICLHGMGGGKESNYIKFLSNTLINEFGKDISFITYDMPGVGESVRSNNFWGLQTHLADVCIDDVISWVLNKNKGANIFIAGFSGSAGSLINYLTDSGNVIKNINKDSITHSFLISPGGSYIESLEWTKYNSLYAPYIAIYHTCSQINYLLKNHEFIRLFNFIKSGGFYIFKDIILSNILLEGNNEYQFNFGAKVKNCDVIISKYDPITNYDIAIKFFNSLNKVNIFEFNFGGHVGVILQKQFGKHAINVINEYAKKNNR